MMDMIFDEKYLIKSVCSKKESIAVWGAYQILQGENSQIVPYIPHLLSSPFSDLREAAVQKIAALGLHEYAGQLLSIFRESEGPLKYAAGIALSKFPNDFSRTILHSWFSHLFVDEQTTRMELEAALVAYLNLDPENGVKEALRSLEELKKDSVKSTVILRTIIPYAETEPVLNQVLSVYFTLRDLYSDPELTFQLIDFYGVIEVTEWLSRNINNGYSIGSIYEQCFSLLRVNATVYDRYWWKEIEQAYLSYDGIHNTTIKDPLVFLEGLNKWCDSILQNIPEPRLQRLGLLVKAYQQRAELFTKTVPKILELESHFLLSVPLIIVMEHALNSWLNHPHDHLEAIAEYYHSSMLIGPHRERILQLFFPGPLNWNEEQVQIVDSEDPTTDDTSVNEAIWKFNRGELLGYDITWANLFPDPQVSRNIAEGLFTIFFHNFSYYIEKRDAVAIDYALLLFQTHPQKGVVDQVLDHFDYLSRYHTEALFQLIEYIPVPEFVAPLLQKYQKEEYEIVELIAVICEIFELPMPEALKEDLAVLENSQGGLLGIQKRVRLHCEICGHSFQYAVEGIYVDEGAILRLNKLAAESVWVPQQFQCKKCAAELPFHLTESQLEELTFQARAERRLKTLPQSQAYPLGQKLLLIEFPRFKSKTYNPDEFRVLVERYEINSAANPKDINLLWTKQAKLYRAMNEWKRCKGVLEKLEERFEPDIEWMFLLGLCNFKLEQYPDSRRYFDWVVRTFPNERMTSPYSSMIEQSNYFIKILDSERSKRARFRVIEGKK